MEGVRVVHSKRTPIGQNRLSTAKKDVFMSTPKGPAVSLTTNEGNLRPRTPLSRKKPTRSRVSFQEPPSRDHRRGVTDEHRKSLLGYDWIAGILDNTSYLAEKSEDFFDELKEFRRVNREECYGRTSVGGLTSIQTTPGRSRAPDLEQDESMVSCENMYTLNERLFPVPIHGPDAPCTVCRTKREPEFEHEGSYVRVSVPRSSLQSPYKVRPHRRVSFDPTDTVGLSAHCLAGWESSKPAVIPAPASLDLKASTAHPSTSGTIQPLRCSQLQNTSDLLDRSLSLNYGLQVMEKQRRKLEQTHHPAGTRTRSSLR